MTNTTIINQYGREIEFNAAVALMDDEIREQIAGEGIDDNQAFFEAYAEAHAVKYGAEWELDKPNPVY